MAGNEKGIDMKLRNKKTGEIIELLAKPSFVKRNDDYLQSEVNTFDSLAELNEEWEDYEEPKEYWYLENNGDIDKETYGEDYYEEKMQEIGNYFDTREEAEKALEKLKAWKRLKEAGANFYGWRRNQTGTYELYMRWYDRIPRSYEVKKDLDLLFNTEED